MRKVDPCFTYIYVSTAGDGMRTKQWYQGDVNRLPGYIPVTHGCPHRVPKRSADHDYGRRG